MVRKTRQNASTSHAHLGKVPVIKRHHRLESPLQQGVDDVVVVLHPLRVGLVALPLGVDATPRERKAEAVEPGGLGEVGVLLVPSS